MNSTTQLEMDLSQIMNKVQSKSELHDVRFQEADERRTATPPPIFEEGASKSDLPQEGDQYGLVELPYHAFEMLAGVGNVLAGFFIKPPNDSRWTTDEQYPRTGVMPIKDPAGSENNQNNRFEVTQINWYWREQPRILQLEFEQFKRLKPDTNEIRQVRRYTDINEVTLSEKNSLITIRYTDGTYEYYKSAEPKKIVHVLFEKAQIYDHMFPVIEN